MTISIKIEDVNEAQRFLCVLNLGLLESLSKNILTIDAANDYLYKPYLSQILEKSGADSKIVELFQESCLLEDIRDIAPAKLEKALQDKRKETLNLLKSLPASTRSKYWLDEFDYE